MTAEIKKTMADGIKQKIKEAGWSVVKTAAISAAITAGVSSTFPAIGFTNGIVAGSVMSIYQQNYTKSKLYFNPFSLAKKVGVKSLVVATKVGITAVTVATTGIYGVCKNVWNKSRKKDKSQISNEVEDNGNGCSEEEDEEIIDVNKLLQIENAQIDTEWVNIHCVKDQTLVIEPWKKYRQ